MGEGLNSGFGLIKRDLWGEQKSLMGFLLICLLFDIILPHGNLKSLVQFLSSEDAWCKQNFHRKPQRAEPRWQTWMKEKS